MLVVFILYTTDFCMASCLMFHVPNKSVYKHSFLEVCSYSCTFFFSCICIKFCFALFFVAVYWTQVLGPFYWTSKCISVFQAVLENVFCSLKCLSICTYDRAANLKFYISLQPSNFSLCQIWIQTEVSSLLHALAIASLLLLHTTKKYMLMIFFICWAHCLSKIFLFLNISSNFFKQS